MPSSSSSNSHDKNEDGSPITPSTPTTTTTTSRAGSRLSNIFTFGRTRSQAQPQVEQQVEHETEDQAVPPRRSSLESNEEKAFDADDDQLSKESDSNSYHSYDETDASTRVPDSGTITPPATTSTTTATTAGAVPKKTLQHFVEKALSDASSITSSPHLTNHQPATSSSTPKSITKEPPARSASKSTSRSQHQLTTDQLMRKHRKSVTASGTGTAGGVGGQAGTGTPPGSPSLAPRISVTDLDAMPEVNLPGFTPHQALERGSHPDSEDMAGPSGTSQQQDTKGGKKPAVPTKSGVGTGGLIRKLSNRLKPGSGTDPEGGVVRKRSLTRPERARRRPARRPGQDFIGASSVALAPGQPSLDRPQPSLPSAQEKRKRKRPKNTPWRWFAKLITCYALPFCLRSCLKTDNRDVHQAWREKMALCTIIFFLCCLLGFITFGFEYLSCGLGNTRNRRFPVEEFNTNVVNIRGDLYNIQGFEHPGRKVEMWKVAGRDAAWLFPVYDQTIPGGQSACSRIQGIKSANIPCTVDGADFRGHCHTVDQSLTMMSQLRVVGKQSYSWSIIEGSDRYMVFNGFVLNLDRYFRQGNNFLGDEEFDRMLVRNLGGDSSMTFSRTPSLRAKMDCLVERFKVGVLESTAPECLASQTFMWLSFFVILSVIFVRFFLACYYLAFKAPDIGREPPKSVEEPLSNEQMAAELNLAPAVVAALEAKKDRDSQRGSLLPTKSRFSHQYNFQTRSNATNSAAWRNSVSSNTGKNMQALRSMLEEDELPGILRTIMVVTCYSEDENGLRTTLDSLARTDFPDSHKLIFLIADGIITGSGNSQSTPDILINMLDLDQQFSSPPEPYSYVAIADGSKRHNMAQVYAGRYRCDDRVVPVILVVKCGTPEEATTRKPGNRGKRDSQILLMNFLSKVMFDDRMTSLEYDLFTKMTALSSSPSVSVPLDKLKKRVTPDLYELVLFVDADTKVMPESMKAMSYTMANDPKVIGLCGETRIANKTESWVTAIQVFEYYLAHFMTKAFESVFGTCTCLPGCFCMYRIKAPKGEVDENGMQYYVPILANPDIVEMYSDNVVDTLHRKNLLLLGEDRYLTTLMLKTFPKRDMVFVPRAVCKTVVPSTFSVLKSQRRRWINSTFHNLLELVLVRDLCGLFCLSLNFIIFMELIGTSVLPAALLFTLFLIIISFFVTPAPIIPLILLAVILGLPAFLILFTARRFVYIFWMMVYLISLPIWNFFLPLYAFWHFDDFTWGETRKLEGGKDHGHGDEEGEFDHSKIVMKRWNEWERERRRESQFLIRKK